MIAAWIGIRQVAAIKRQGKATFLFELDKMWESKEFAGARTKFDKLRKAVEDWCDQNHAYLDGTGKEERIRERMAEVMSKLREENLEEYTDIMKLCGFYETAGMLVERGYVAFEDIYGLYGGSIVRLYSCMRTHIAKRAEGMPPGYLEYFLKLAKKAAIQAARDR